MDTLLHALTAPWPWYVAGPILGLMVPAMLLIGSRSFGISQNLEHLCAITQPSAIKVHFFKYDWRASTWSLMFATGTALGGFLAAVVFANPFPVLVSPATLDMLAGWGFAPPSGGLLPPEIFALTPRNVVLLIGGGVLIGFGTRYAGGCTSGHGITGLALLQPQSLLAMAGLFSGGLLASHLLVPFLH